LKRGLSFQKGFIKPIQSPFLAKTTISKLTRNVAEDFIKCLEYELSDDFEVHKIGIDIFRKKASY